MPTLSLTDLVDIVLASGTPKMTKVRQVKHRAPYLPSTDYYRRLREGIIACHEAGHAKADLHGHVGLVNEPSKATNYPLLECGYAKWWGTKALGWFRPPTGTYSAHGVDVRVNPELGLSVSGRAHIIKLYFKAPELPKNRADIITEVMNSRLGRASPAGTIFGVLDVRRAKLVTPTVPIPGLSGALKAELAYVAALWPTV